jgi:DNA primase
VTISLAASSRNSSSFGNEAIRDQFAIGFAPLEKSALLHAAQAAGFSANEMTEVGLVSRRAAAARCRIGFEVD